MIETHELTKRYGSTTAVDRLSLVVKPGRVTGFLGPNGSGKSTTLRMILGLAHPTGGHALVGGRPYSELRRPLHEVGAMLDPGAVHPGRTARDHLRSIALTTGISAARVGAVLELTGLTPVARRRVGGFSLGMRQRLGIAAALLGDPPAVILDEPVNGLDPEGIQWIRNLLRGMAAEGRAVLVSSHLMTEMEQTADHLIVIGRGRLIADTGMAEFVRGASRTDVLVRVDDPGRLASVLVGAGGDVASEADGALAVRGLAPRRIGDLAARADVAVHELAVRRATLEQAYFEATENAVEYRAGDGGRR
ncbi:ABC transporter ATP-binding protein [Actinomadura harenae]|uniref:ATP-binding cassette domain-containing protein n=1 Tax=Actinomadura harenae TaxID=2483351 RepID=A0A3M2LFY3_9ACTN|nr:ATP-binding cassette domain-containing protein [Actinomadura harenae]RMI36421.1 ATP-binding cassette domain-containing protein [Actinomadura harenae]